MTFFQKVSPLLFHLFPNPARDLVKLEWSPIENTDGKMEIVLLNVDGKQILKRQVAAETGSFQIETSALLPGIYLFKVKIDGKNTFSEKLILIK